MIARSTAAPLQFPSSLRSSAAPQVSIQKAIQDAAKTINRRNSFNSLLVGGLIGGGVALGGYLLASAIRSSSNAKTSKNFLEEKTPDVSMEDVAGLTDQTRGNINRIIAKLQGENKQIEESISPHSSDDNNNIIMYGEPGTGKTLLAEAMAKEMNAVFYKTSGANFDTGVFGAGAKNVTKMFDEVEKKQQEKGKPVFLFIDEIDSLLSARGNNQFLDNTINAFLERYDEVKKNKKIIIVGATNRFDYLDDAARRRLPNHIEIEMPDEKGRYDILKVHVNMGYKVGKDKKDQEKILNNIAQKTGPADGIHKGYSGSYLKDLLVKAKDIAVERIKQGDESIKYITEGDFKEALEIMKPPTEARSYFSRFKPPTEARSYFSRWRIK